MAEGLMCFFRTIPGRNSPPKESIREQTGKGPGDTVEVVVWTHRKEYCRWITDAKKEETRLKRLGKAIEMLKKGISTPG